MPEGSAAASTTPAPPAPPDALEQALHRLFGHAAFRDGQREIVETVLAGQDVLAVLPTGAGKSLLYQLPAFLLPGVTLAVSPLIALMKDQLDKLVERGLPAAVINSALSLGEQDDVLERVARGEIKLLLVAPERFRSGRFRSALARAKVSLLAVDEAHCVSEWGHDFRPDYDRIGDAAHAIARPPNGRPPILAVTATATERVRRDIARSLDLAPEHRVFIRGFDRPNLHFSVEQASGDAEKARVVTQAIAATKGQGSVIVYCSTRKSCEKVAARLGKGVPVYHAGMRPQDRRDVQERWQRGEARVVVATNAFGLGIDKEDVRLVCHHDLPGSVEAYYQEAGRAGRDGKEAQCVLVFSAADVHLQTWLADSSFPDRPAIEAVARELARAKGSVDPATVRERLPDSDLSERAVGSARRILEGAGLARSEPGDQFLGAGPELESAELPVDWARLDRQRAHERDKLARVLAYARSATCRRAAILRYFGAVPSTGARASVSCGKCDRCLAPEGDRLPEAEALVVARKVLSLVARVKGRFGRGVVARLLAGEVEPEDEARGVASLPTVGALKPWSTAACGSAVDACLAHELLETYTEDGKYPKLRLTSRGVEVLLGREQASLAILNPATSKARKGRRRAEADDEGEAPRRKRRASSEPTVALGALEEEALAELKRWRAEKAREAELPAYCVFHDKTLAALVAARPTDLASLLEVSGVGSKKAERWGEELLALLAPWSNSKAPNP